MGSTVDDGEMIEQLRQEIDILDRVLYRHTNQHRRAKYFNQLVIVRKRARLILNSKDYHKVGADEIKRVQDLAVAAAETFHSLVGTKLFYAFCACVHFFVGKNCVYPTNNTTCYIGEEETKYKKFH